MKVLARYISWIFIKNFFFASLGLTALFLFQALLGDLLDPDIKASQIIYYHALNLPQVYLQMSPAAVLMGTVLTLSGMSRHHELVACYSVGIGLQQVVGVVVSLVFMIACLSLVLDDRVVPPLYRKRTAFYWQVIQKRQDFFLDFKQDKIWYRSDNLIFNLRNFDRKTKTITGMTIYTFDDKFDLARVTEAKEAIFADGNWRLIGGTDTTFTGEDDLPVTEGFEEKALKISETPRDFQEIEKEVDGLRLKELWAYIRRTKATGMDTKAYEVKLHSRVSLTFIPLVMCLLAVPFSIRGRREGGIARDLGICLAITFFYWLFHSVGLSLGLNGTLPPVVAAWAPSVIFASLAVGLGFNKQ